MSEYKLSGSISKDSKTFHNDGMDDDAMNAEGWAHPHTWDARAKSILEYMGLS